MAIRIPLYKAHVPEGAGQAVEQVLRSGQIAGDGYLPDFENKLKEFLGAAYLAATSEFSRSLEMALRMAGVRPGDAVLMSPLACLATTTPLLQVGARPVWCDVDPETGAIDAEEIRRRYVPGAKAVLLYHWVGIPGDIAGVMRAAGEVGVKVVEDAGESLGAEYAGRRVGANGCDYSVFSFSPVRHITTGEGSAITFRDEEQYRLALIWRRYGIPPAEFRDELGEIRPECNISVPGFNNFMNRVAGALGSLQMEALPGIVAAHRGNGQFFDRGLAKVPGVRVLQYREGSVPSYWVYCFRCERRDDLLRKLRQAGVYASKVHARNDTYACFGGPPADLPGVAEFEAEQLSIPCGWWVTTEEREYILDVIRSGW